MAQITKEITLDVAKKNLLQAIVAKQHDSNSRFLKVTLCNEGVMINVPSTASALINAERADKTSQSYAGAVNEDGTVTVPLTNWMLELDDIVRCSISIIDSGEQKLSTTSFSLEVEAAEYEGTDISEDENYDILVTLLSDCTTAKDEANTARDAANTAASEANTARDAANTAASEANTARDAANTAASEANTARDAANTAASEANTAANRANTAAAQAEAVVEQASQLVTRYGVRFEGSANTGATVKRLYNAGGLVAGVGTDTETADNDFDNIYPWSHIRRCCGGWDDNGHFVVNAYKGEPGFAVDGSNGEVWVEYPLFFYSHEYGDDNSETIVISATQLPGMLPAPTFISEDGQLYQKAYIPAYLMAEVDNRPTSRSGVFSDASSANQSMTAARKAGPDYTVTTTAEWYMLCLLMWVEFATRDLQTVMRSPTSLSYSNGDTALVAESGVNRIIVTEDVAAGYVVGQTVAIGTRRGDRSIASNRIVTSFASVGADRAINFDGAPVDIAVGNVVWSLGWKNGSCDGVLSSSGSPVSNINGKYNCIYRGLEAPYGNGLAAIADILVKQEGTGTDEDPYTYDIYFLPNPTQYAAGTITADYVKLNYTVPGETGYVKKLGFDSRFPWLRIPAEIGASSNTYYSDRYFPPSYPLCCARIGGLLSNGPPVGPCYWFCGNTPSSGAVGFCARLSYHRRAGGMGGGQPPT